MARLNQIIAIASGKKTQVEKALTEIYYKVQKEALLKGIARTYRPKDDAGDRLPPESKSVQFTVAQALAETSAVLTDLFDVIATQEYANTKAKADVIVEGVTILTDVPVSYLLFLEKQLQNIHSLVDKLPVLDPGEHWERTVSADCWGTVPAETVRTKKVLRNHVKAEATDKHPAQVDVYHEDVIVGYWNTINYSGAIPEADKKAILGRVVKLQEAVKSAREMANSIEITNQQVGEDVFAYLFKE